MIHGLSGAGLPSASTRRGEAGPSGVGVMATSLPVGRSGGPLGRGARLPSPAMARTYVVTGSASGIGRATCELLESEGHRVVDVDLHDAAVTADLATPAGRAAMVEAVTAATGGAVDAVVANAGVSAPAELC